MLQKTIEHLHILLGISFGFISHYLGGWDMMLKTILLFVILDFLTGWLKSVYSKTLSSETGFKGLIRKLVIFIVITVANLLQKLLNDKIPLRETMLMFYIINEALSIIENASYFIPIPEKIKNVLLQLNQKYENEK